MTVYFHGNFGLNRKRMAGILNLSLENSDLKDQKIAEKFGYNAPFTARYRSWLHKTGLIQLKYPIKLTEKGMVVYENDPTLSSLTTQWFLHHELTTDPERTEAWYYFTNEFLPKYKKFSKGDLLSGLTDKLRTHSETHFGPGSKLNRVILRKLLECYIEEEALGELNVIARDNLDFITTYNPSGPWESPSDLQKAYRQATD